MLVKWMDMNSIFVFLMNHLEFSTDMFLTGYYQQKNHSFHFYGEKFARTSFSSCLFRYSVVRDIYIYLYMHVIRTRLQYKLGIHIRNPVRFVCYYEY